MQAEERAQGIVPAGGRGAAGQTRGGGVLHTQTWRRGDHASEPGSRETHSWGL